MRTGRAGRRITRTTALELASIRRVQILKGEVGIRKPKDISFAEAKELFLKWLEANKRANTTKSCKSHMKQLTVSFGSRKLSAISPFLIEQHRIRRLREGCPVALNRELAYLKLLFNKCRKWKKCEGLNPVAGIKRAKESQGRIRALTKDEEARLLGAAREPLRTIILASTQGYEWLPRFLPCSGRTWTWSPAT